MCQFLRDTEAYVYPSNTTWELLVAVTRLTRTQRHHTIGATIRNQKWNDLLSCTVLTVVVRSTQRHISVPFLQQQAYYDHGRSGKPSRACELNIRQTCRASWASYLDSIPAIATAIPDDRSAKCRKIRSKRSIVADCTGTHPRDIKHGLGNAIFPNILRT